MGLKDIINSIRQQEPQQPADDGEIKNVGDALWAHLATLNDQKDERRKPGYHPSQMYGFCARREILEFFFPKPEANIITPDLQMIFDWGTAWHWMVQNHHFGPMGILWGRWRCNTCARVLEDSFMPLPCTTCHGSREWKGPRRGGWWTYEEPHVYSKEWNIPGHGDGIVILNKKIDGKKKLLEIKTINSNSFQRLSRPDKKYVFQISIYLWLLDLDECVLVYFSKEAGGVKPKTFIVKRDDSIIEDVKNRITLHRRSWPEKRLCTGVCRDETDDLAMACPHRNNCFNKQIEEIIEVMRKKMLVEKGELPL